MKPSSISLLLSQTDDVDRVEQHSQLYGRLTFPNGETPPKVMNRTHNGLMPFADSESKCIKLKHIYFHNFNRFTIQTDPDGNVSAIMHTFGASIISSKPMVSGFAADQFQDQLKRYNDLQSEFFMRFNGWQQQVSLPQQFPNFQIPNIQQPMVDFSKQLTELQQRFNEAQQIAMAQRPLFVNPQPQPQPPVQNPTQIRFATDAAPKPDPPKPEPEMPFSNSGNFPYPHWPSFRQQTNRPGWYPSPAQTYYQGPPTGSGPQM